MRILALFSGSLIALAAAAGREELPKPLAKDFATLGSATSLSVDSTVRVASGIAQPYTLTLAKPNLFRLTTAAGSVSSDGKTLVTYKAATKTYKEEPLTEASLAEFLKRTEVQPWAPFFQKNPAMEVMAAKAGASRKIMGFDTDSVHVEPKAGLVADLFIDKKLGIVRAAVYGTATMAAIVQAKAIELNKPVRGDVFAFVAPEGASKEVPLPTFAMVKPLLADRCMPCHSAERHSHGVNVETYEGTVATVVVGNPAGSILVRSVKGDGVRKMPLGNHPALNESEIKLLEDWIVGGAKP